MEALQQILAEHPFLQGIEPRHLQYIAEYASEESFEAGQYILREGEEANYFYLIRQGKVALGTFIPGRGFTTIQTVGEGEIVGWSWLVPPYHWHFNALIVLPTLTITIDGKRLREKCEEDHSLGFDITKRLLGVIGQRLRVTRMRLG